ncbi:MAG TPA: O-antigen ligase family protein [Roseiflexaceae bacterium]|nr:O-antigen ligase family protein [Roseiflexaceae bacterium]
MNFDKMSALSGTNRLLTRSPAHLPFWVILGFLVIGLALVPLPLLAQALGWGLAVALALIDPAFGLFLAVLSVPAQELVHLPGGLSYTQAAMLVAVGAWGLRALAHPERRIVLGRLLPLWAALLWALLLAASFTPYSHTEAFKESLRWGEAFLIWLLAVNTIKRPWHIAGLVACLLLAPAANAAIGLFQFASGDGPPSFRIAADSQFVRAYGTIGAPNSFAGYMNMAWPLALALAVGLTWSAWRRSTTDQLETRRQGDKETRGRRDSSWFLVLGSWFLVLLLVAALVSSFSRGGWVGAAFGLLVMALTLGRPTARWAIGIIGAGALLLAIGGAGLLPQPIAARLASLTRSVSIFDASTVQVTDENFAVVERMAQLQAGWRMFAAHPLGGVGPGNYNAAYPDFAVIPWYASRGHAHNYYLHMAAEAGALGALAYLALLAGVVYQGLTALRNTNAIFRRSIAVGCCGIIAATAGHNLFENLHVLSMGVQLAAVWGLIVVLANWQPRN